MSWLDREEGEVRVQLLKSSSRHARWMGFYKLVLTALAWVILAAAGLVARVVYLELQAAKPATALRVYLAWTVGLLVAVYLAGLLVDAVSSCIAGLRGPFVMAVLRIMIAEQCRCAA